MSPSAVNQIKIARRNRILTGLWGMGNFFVSLLAVVLMIVYSSSDDVTTPQWVMIGGFCLSFISLLISLDEPQFKARTVYIIDTLVFVGQVTPMITLVTQGQFLWTGIAIGMSFIGFLVHTALFIARSPRDISRIQNDEANVDKLCNCGHPKKHHHDRSNPANNGRLICGWNMCKCQDYDISDDSEHDVL